MTIAFEPPAPSRETVRAFIDAAKGLLGENGFTQDEATIGPWLTDWRGRYTGKALGMAMPRSTDEVAALVRLCGKHGIPLVPQGGNSGMVGGATPDESGSSLLLSLRRMTDCRIDTDGMTADCGAGFVLQNLHDAAAAQNLRFPLSLGGKGSATVGGLIATNAGGTQVLRHGVMRALVAGLEVVTPDGDILDLTAPLKKDNRGFDLKQIYIGSEGTLGIVTRAVLDLVPAIAERRVVWVGLESLADARKLLLHCEGAMGPALEGFEVLPEACLRTVVDYLPDAKRPVEDAHEWHALLEFVADRSGAETLGDRVEACLADAMEQGLLADAAIAASETQADRFWALRESIALAERAHGPAVQHDISVAPAQMPEVLALLETEIAQHFPDHAVRGFGHLGDGNIHLHVLAPAGVERMAWERETGKAISAHIYRFLAQCGGSISAEHGIGQDKRDMLAETREPEVLHVMRAVKRALDPANLLNPGKLVVP